MKTKKYEVIVGNVGRVHEGTDYTKAITEFQTWVEQVGLPYGRATGESVVIFEDGEIIGERAQTTQEE